jgi:hypothetical protein
MIRKGLLGYVSAGTGPLLHSTAITAAEKIEGNPCIVLSGSW